MAKDDNPFRKTTKVGWHVDITPPDSTTFVPDIPSSPEKLSKSQSSQSDKDEVTITKVLTTPPVQRKTKKGGHIVVLYPKTLMREEMVVIPSDGLSVGRHISNDLVLNHESVSRFHAKIEYQEGRYILTDLNSTNGTFVQEKRIKKSILRGGENIRFGEVLIKFLSGNNVEAEFHELMLKMTREDILTGTLNKRIFTHELEKTIPQVVRKHIPLSLLMLDLDHFKKVNDTYGHLAGDLVLREIGLRLKQSSPSQALVARYGGEEFVILLPGMSRLQAVSVGEGIRHAIASSPVIAAGHPITITVSIGIAGLEELPIPDSQTLIDLADKKLYKAKKEGRNKVVI